MPSACYILEFNIWFERLPACPSSRPLPLRPHMTNEQSCHRFPHIPPTYMSLSPFSSSCNPSTTGCFPGCLTFYLDLRAASSATSSCTCNHNSVPEALHIVVLCLAVVCCSPPALLPPSTSAFSLIFGSFEYCSANANRDVQLLGCRTLNIKYIPNRSRSILYP